MSVRELASQGCHVMMVSGSVADPTVVERAFLELSTPSPGVVHFRLF
jgi:hypothetical protein